MENKIQKLQHVNKMTKVCIKNTYARSRWINILFRPALKLKWKHLQNKFLYAY